MSFDELARAGTANPAVLARGIGQALVTTAAGLMVAIPIIMGHHYLSGRVDSILAEIDRRREEFMGRVVQVMTTNQRKNPERNEARSQGSSSSDKAQNPFQGGVDYETFDPA